MAAHFTGMPLVRSIDKNLHEIRVSKYRVYFTHRAGVLLVLAAGEKDTQLKRHPASPKENAVTDALDRMVDRIRVDDPAMGAEYDHQRARAEIIRPVVEARRARGWSQRDLATAAGVQQPVIARLENGDTDPKISTVTKLCRALGLRLVYIDDAELRAG